MKGPVGRENSLEALTGGVDSSTPPGERLLAVDVLAAGVRLSSRINAINRTRCALFPRRAC